MAYVRRGLRGYLSGFGVVNATRFLAADDSVSAPGFSYTSDPNTGIYRSASDAVGVARGGVFGLILDTSTNVFANATTTQFGSGFTLLNDISPSQITSNQTDYNPTGLASAARIRVDIDAARTINSLSGGADGRQIRISNISAFTLTLLHDDGATGTASMRFLCPNNANYAIRQNGAVDIEYDSTSSRWRVLGA